MENFRTDKNRVKCTRNHLNFAHFNKSRPKDKQLYQHKNACKLQNATPDWKSHKGNVNLLTRISS